MFGNQQYGTYGIVLFSCLIYINLATYAYFKQVFREKK